MSHRIKELSSANNIFQRIEVLKRNRHKRHQYQEFYVEGVESLNLALEYGWSFRCLCFSKDRKLSKWAETFIEKSAVDECYALTAELMEVLSDKEDPSELVAVVKNKKMSLAEVPVTPVPLFLLLDRPMNPGNLGSTLRSAAAFSADAVIICGHSCDPFEPLAIRSSIGTIFTVPIVQVASPAQLTPWIQQQKARCPDFQVIGSSHNGNHSIERINFRLPTLLLLGNETTGLSQHFISICEKLTRIETSGVTSSLNISAAATVFLYEVSRQRAL